ncbi:MAG: GxxExxY protein [Candidatus Aminicenantes bacterium]|nr:GxxExxY protein [Candidatus Aminicenantes bacterium]
MKEKKEKNIISNQSRSTSNYKYSDITDKIIAAAYNVFNVLGYGFLEKVYENALFYEIQKLGLFVRQQSPIQVVYDNLAVGDYFADLVVEEKIIVELKAVSILEPIHEVQLVNYLKATGIEVGLLINFGQKLTVRRRVFSRDIKTLKNAE